MREQAESLRAVKVGGPQTTNYTTPTITSYKSDSKTDSQYVYISFLTAIRISAYV